ncbi:MAG: hypothetical protein HY761_06115 [Candidatus Omnitrophica bacterium]|nr:hypothetical protein [Candidatus Omnitrophota bacterium]
MNRKLKIIIPILVMINLFYLHSSFAQDKALKDFKKAYLEYNFHWVPLPLVKPLQESEKDDFRQRCASKLKDIGFELVDDKENADIIVKFYIEEAKKMLFGGWDADLAWVQFSLPQNGFIVANYFSTFPASIIVDPSTVADHENRVLDFVKKDYDSGKLLVTILPDGTSSDYKVPSEPKYKYTMVNGKVISEGQEKMNHGLWDDPVKALGELKVKGNPGSKKKIAILVYRFFGFPNAASVKPNAFFLLKPTFPEDTLAERYGYLVTYHVKEGKYLANFSPQKWFEGEGNVPFLNDISYILSEKIEDYFLEKGYVVLNLTPARYQFVDMKDNEISELTLRKYGIDEILVVAYVGRTKSYSVSSYGSYRETKQEVGLRIDYIVNVCKKNSGSALLFGGVLEASPPEATLWRYSRLNFYSVKKNRDGEIVSFGDGVIDDDWIIEKTLRKFLGYEKGLTKKVRIGGDFFESLSKKGY